MRAEKSRSRERDNRGAGGDVSRDGRRERERDRERERERERDRDERDRGRDRNRNAFGWSKKQVPTSRSGRIVKGRGVFVSNIITTHSSPVLTNLFTTSSCSASAPPRAVARRA